MTGPMGACRDELGPPLLTVEDLRVTFDTREGPVRAVEGVSFEVFAGEVLGVVGESGSGKTVTMMSLLGLLTNATVTGSARLEGVELLGLDLRRMRRIRGERIGFIFQDPMTTLNPVLKVGTQLVETIRAHRNVDRGEAQAAALGLLKAVGIPDADRRLRQYPVQLSGGMRQRVMTALALANAPELIIADEPTTAVDVTIQAQVLELLAEVRQRDGAAVVIVTHDLGVIAETADRVVVMYAGRIVEKCDVYELFDHPAHHYTKGLLASRPQIGDVRERLAGISGTAPNPNEGPFVGCPFRTRCERGRDDDRCRNVEPQLVEVRPGHTAACHYPLVHDAVGGP
jgi:oligopeptide/dipeptide ABC transporter ATP-binding protein